MAKGLLRAMALGFLVAGPLLGLAGCKGLITPPPTLTPTPLGSSERGIATPTIALEIYLTPIPPTPTFTPSPTPTPVIHIVEQGDTLFGVALEYGVTVDALLRANLLNEEDYLRIGQSLIIPFEEEEDLAEGEMQVPTGNVILPTPTPLPLSIAGVARYQTPVGGIWCMGEVVNTTGEAITNLQVEVVLLAPDESPLMTSRTLAAADYLSPEARAPFSLLFRNPPEGVSDVQVRLIRGEPISPITAGFVPLSVVDAEGAVSGPQYRVRGRVLNESAQVLTRLSVVATIYNDEGKVIGYRQLVLGDDINLSSGAAQPFELLLTPQVLDVPSDFSVIAWGMTG
ncbi:MAG: LysM peptidoglycan-binding domain-containing protein [Anaerolineae bacterium]